jgi:hypothetical protein
LWRRAEEIRDALTVNDKVYYGDAEGPRLSRTSPSPEIGDPACDVERQGDDPTVGLA